MTEQNHLWCRDVRRDEAIRAAEDAAAVPAIQHRDLPDIVADLRERVARMEAAVTPKSVSLSNAEGLRTERVTLEVTQRTESYAPLSEFDWTAMLRSACRGRLFYGESVRVVEEPAEIALITAERDLARAVRDGLRSQRDAASARVAELEAAPPPRGWLTAEERAGVEEAMVDYASNVGDSDCERIERVLRALLARETPPMVRRPEYENHSRARDCQWIAAIRAAGGEVE